MKYNTFYFSAETLKLIYESTFILECNTEMYILQFLFIVMFMLHDGQFFQNSAFRIETGCFKGTERVISSDPPCKDGSA